MKKPIYPRETENEDRETKRQESGRKITIATKPGLSEALCCRWRGSNEGNLPSFGSVLDFFALSLKDHRYKTYEGTLKER